MFAGNVQGCCFVITNQSGVLSVLLPILMERGSSAAAALHVLQIVHAPAVSAFLPDTFFFKVILLLLLKGFGNFPEQNL